MTEASNGANQGSHFNGLRVIAFESRRADDMKTLIEKCGGVATVVPSMREVPLEENPRILEFEQALLAQELDVTVFMTGVGTRLLAEFLDTRLPHGKWVEAIARTQVVARGPKPHSVLRELGIPVASRVPPPHTWREVLTVLEARKSAQSLRSRRLALQEYGLPNRALVKQLEARGARVLRVPIYRWALPEDVGPLQRAIGDIAENRFDVALFTNGTQVWHLFKLAYKRGMEDDLRQGLQRMMVASIGPITTDALHEFELESDFHPDQLKMSQLVRQAAAHCQGILAAKGSALHSG